MINPSKGQKLSEEELLQRLAVAAKLVTVGAEYRHYKDKLYKVLDLAILESNNEVCVIYQAQYGQKLKFIRPVSVWVEDVELEGKTLKRFTKM